MPDINKPECQWSEVASWIVQVMPFCKVGVNFKFTCLHHWLVVRNQEFRIVAMWTKSPAVSWSLQSHACFLPDYHGVFSSRWIQAVQSGVIIWTILTWTFDRVICAELQLFIWSNGHRTMTMQTETIEEQLFWHLIF